MHLFALLILLAAGASAQTKSPFDGDWIIAAERGPRPMEATFEVHGNELTGKVKLGNGTIVPISSGKVDGSNISFYFEGQTKKRLYLSGALDGDIIRLELSWGPGENGSPFTAKRK